MMTAKEFLRNKFQHLGKVNKLENEIIDLQFNDLCELMEKYANQSKWISVNERLPEKNKAVIIYSSWSGLHTAMLDKYNRWINIFALKVSDVTHWMPLPQKP